jgi:hypothetical protein
MTLPPTPQPVPLSASIPQMPPQPVSGAVSPSPATVAPVTGDGDPAAPLPLAELQRRANPGPKGNPR